MAALSMGAFGTYKHAYHKYMQERLEREKPLKGPEFETVWVTKRYNPLDLRVRAPVSRHKLIAVGKLQTPTESHWVPVTDPSLKSFDRGNRPIYSSFPSTRCEDWSTLRQILPSMGSASRVRPPNWGTSPGPPPVMQERSPGRLPHVNSAMTRYQDDMHAANPSFRLH